MTTVRAPDGIDHDRAASPVSGRGLWARRAVLVVLAAVVALGLANTFGQAPSLSQAQSPAATLLVSAPTDLRGGLIFQVRVRIRAHRGLRHPRLVFSQGWFEQMTLNSSAPQPATQASRNGSTVFGLAPIAAGSQAVYWFYFQVNPTNTGWNRAENLQLKDGSATLATIHRSVTIYP